MKSTLLTLAALLLPVAAALAQTDHKIRQILADRIEIVSANSPYHQQSDQRPANGLLRCRLIGVDRRCEIPIPPEIEVET